MKRGVITHYWVRFTILAAFSALLWIGYPAYVAFKAGEGVSQQGQFGDLFGGLTALFTALAFAALVTTMLMQMDELREQRSEKAHSDFLSASGIRLQAMTARIEAYNDQINHAHRTHAAKVDLNRLVQERDRCIADLNRHLEEADRLLRAAREKLGLPNP